MNDETDTVGNYVDALLADLDTATPAPAAPAPDPGPATPAPVVAPTTPGLLTTTPASMAPRLPGPVVAPPPPAMERPASDGVRRWLRVTVGGDRYALALLRVQEVTRPAPVVPLRGVGVAMLGVMNLRGRVVPVLDLGLWLGCAAVVPGEANRIVVVERDDELLGMLVASVQDVLALGPADIEPPLAGTDPGAILGVARPGGGMPTVLFDADALYQPAQAQVGIAAAVNAGEPSRRDLRP